MFSIDEPVRVKAGLADGSIRLVVGTHCLAAKGVALTAARGAEGSGLHGVQATPQGLVGGADRRREGVAMGE